LTSKKKNVEEIITGKEQNQIDSITEYFSKYPISFFGENPVKHKLCTTYGYDPLKDKKRLTQLTREIYRQRMIALAIQNPGYQNFEVINHTSTTEAEPEDRVIGGGN
jgi:hypothetical protein